ncbi:MAG: archaellin/type IV pilin N-terminal domain-containing protein [Candidatus Bathyarchaeia archaeon]|nr:flagellin [Candidatus Bathyarchaeota archaeon]
MAWRNFLKSKRGIVGIEAAIVLIAFVVIASALAYVVINMGFYSAQKAKETIDRGVGEATSSLQLDGTVVGKTNSQSKIQYLVIPVKLAVGQSEVDLSNKTVTVSVFYTNFTLANIYKGTYNGSDETNVDSLLNASLLSDEGAMFAIYNDDGDSVLEVNEKAFLVIKLGDEHVLVSYSKVKIEVRTSRGAALTVERLIPVGLPENAYVDLG